MRNYINRKWHEFTTEIWHEGYVIGSNRAKQAVIRELRMAIKEEQLANYKSKHLKLGYFYAQQAILQKLEEIESR